MLLVVTVEIMPVVTFSVVTYEVSAQSVFVLSAAVWIGDVSIHPPPVPMVIVFVVTEDVVAILMFAVEAFVTRELMIPIVAVLMTAELVKKAEVERIEGMEDRYPTVPRPATVDVKLPVVRPPPPPPPIPVEKEENDREIKFVVEISTVLRVPAEI